ncbi:hypothetical protein G3R49_09365 [Shewanella sp. WXL01]|uniref:Porin family protein n=1 Tax=Shewanella maritima TaxID=2520507 RepID=A0A411PJP5_9GAMM|nr:MULTISPECIES: hypothetical protein [Shewanella]NKF50777.1 hypothetical protein [Shewanella sp. WXL01]QBF83763.1 hypothetical protein EXU30_14475 [Shewanella maritima]
MKKSAIAVAALLALSTGMANASVLNGFTGKVESEYTTQDKSAYVEGRVGYDFNFGAVSVVPFLSAETNYNDLGDKRWDSGNLGGGITIQTNFDNFYAYVDGRAMRKDRIKVPAPTGELPELPTPELPEIGGATPYASGVNSPNGINSVLKEYKLELGTGYKFDNGIQVGVEGSFIRERFEGVNSDQREFFGVLGYEAFEGFTVYGKVGRADTKEPQPQLMSSKKDEWETKSVIGVSYRF